MGEPIRLYDAAGNVVVMYSPTIAAAAVEAGELFTQIQGGDNGQVQGQGEEGQARETQGRQTGRQAVGKRKGQGGGL